MTLRSWVVVGPVGGRPARNVWYSPHYAHVRGVTGADQPQHRSSASPPPGQRKTPHRSVPRNCSSVRGTLFPPL